MVGNHLLSHTVAGNLAIAHFASDGGAGVGDFSTATIVDAEHHIDDLVVLGALLGGFKLVDHRLPQLGATAGPAHAHTPLVYLFHTTVDDFTRETHEEAHFLWRALPVFSGERVQAQIPYTGFDGTGDSVEHHRFGGLMAIGADHAALLGPTTITVHNHTDMAGYLVLGEVGNTSGVAERSCGNVQRRVINVLKSHTHESIKRSERIGRSR